MIEYPSIPAEIQRGVRIVAFDKLDGQNVRAEWTQKKGLHKFATKTRLLCPEEGVISKAEAIILDKYDELNDALRSTRQQKATCFFEFWGPKSQFGMHQDDDEHTVTLIDIALHKQGILPPKEFLKLTRDMDIPDVLYEGNCNDPFIKSVNDGTLEGLGSEGVVCKGPFDRKLQRPVMWKVKRYDWYERLREHCQGNDDMFKTLA
jgi:hypothetical protein